MQQIYIVCASLLCLLLLLLVRKRKSRRFPPGPKGLPLLGNLFDAPQGRESTLVYKEWGRRFGSDVIHLKIFGTHLVVLNSPKAAMDLLDKRSTMYSGRAQTVMLFELTGYQRDWGLLDYGHSWKKHLQVHYQHFRPMALQAYHPQMTKGVRRLLRLLHETPKAYVSHLRFMAGTTIIDIVYGIDPKSIDDPFIKLAEEGTKVFSTAAVAGAFLVDALPILKYLPSWLPGAGFKRRAAQWKEAVDAMYELPFNEVKAALRRGDAKPSIASSLLETLKDSESDSEMEDIIMDVTGTAYPTASDTTIITLSSFILAMLLHPEAQRAAQAELDRVVGSSRLPSFEDRASLPYITAIMRETLRWRPVIPLGIPHKSMEDDEYQGYYIPSGSIVMANIWAILHDETRYPNPDVFDPIRFLTAGGQLNPDVPEPTETFGHGRRICAGRYFAMDMLWLAMANILHVYRIEKALDDKGNVIEPSGVYGDGLLSAPEPFEAAFKARSHALLDLIQSSD